MHAYVLIRVHVILVFIGNEVEGRSFGVVGAPFIWAVEGA